MSLPEFSSPPALAKLLGIEPPKVRAWIVSGELTAIDVAQRRGGRPRYRIAREAVEAFLRRRSTVPAPRVPRAKKQEAADPHGLLT